MTPLGLSANTIAEAVSAELFEMAQDAEEIIHARTNSGSSAGRIGYESVFGEVFQVIRNRTPQQRLEYRQRRAARRAEAGNADRA